MSANSSAPEAACTVALPGSLRAARRGAVGVLTLTRPAKRNALDLHTVLGIEDYFRNLPAGIGCVVLDAEGEHFSAGLDLSEVTESEIEEGVAHSRHWHRAFDAVQYGSVPVIAVLHGAVVGGGFELAAATHIRIADQSAYYGLPEGQRGIFVGGGGAVRIPRLIGVPMMMDMMLTGRTIGAEDGFRLGYAQYLVETGGGRAKAMELADKIAGNAPMTNFALIHALPRIAEADPQTGLVMEALMAAIAVGSHEAKSRLRDFLEKRAGKVVHR